MRAFINKVLGAAGKYTVWDFTFLKITLLSLGIILGAYYGDFFLRYIFFLWVVFIVSYLWIMYRTFVKHMN
ncbi:MAG: hypothetical protein MJA84_10015 [Firmicutes bacterium]|nr:hypothetical protein [Bacillota bacterium]